METWNTLTFIVTSLGGVVAGLLAVLVQRLFGRHRR